MRGFTIAVLLVLAVLLAAPAIAEARSETTTPSVYVSIHVTLTNRKVVLYPKKEPRGAAARFIIRNRGTKPIAFSVGKQTPGLGVLFGFHRVFKPGERRIVLVYLDKRGLLPYYAGKSYEQAKSAQKGKLVIGATCRLCAPPGPPPLP